MQTPSEKLTSRVRKLCSVIGRKSVSICVHLWLNCSVSEHRIRRISA
jgi:hypothetical protein